MRSWSPERIAQAAGARLHSGPSTTTAGPSTTTGPERTVIDSRQAGPGALFVGLPGATLDGGAFATRALAGGAWGVMVAPGHADAAQHAGLAQPDAGQHAHGAGQHAHGAGHAASGPSGVILSVKDPLGALQRLAGAWRRELDASVIAITGSTGKTTTKDLLLAILAPHRRTVASRANFNTEIGLPLEILGAPAGTEVLVLEMGMRGAGQIAALAAIAQPDVAVVLNVGPVHLEALGTLQGVAAAKAELIAELAPGATAIVPAGETLLEPHLRDDVEIVTFGERGDVRLHRASGQCLQIDLSGWPTGQPGTRLTLKVPSSLSTQAHLRLNLLAAVAAASAVGVTPRGRIEPTLSAGRGQRLAVENGVTLIDDSYNANPMSMRAALDDLAATAARERSRRRVAVLGDMLELGPDERSYHIEAGQQACAAGVDLLVTVGARAIAIAEGFAGETFPVADAGQAAALVPGLLRPGDAVLVKASRGIGLELVCHALGAPR